MVGRANVSPPARLSDVVAQKISRFRQDDIVALSPHALNLNINPIADPFGERLGRVASTPKAKEYVRVIWAGNKTWSVYSVKFIDLIDSASYLIERKTQ